MKIPGIVIVGLGPADAQLLTREAWEWLSQTDEVYLRTSLHPCAAELPKTLSVQSFDALYEKHDALGDVLDEIVNTVLELGKRAQGVTYAVPGSPWVAEETRL